MLQEEFVMIQDMETNASITDDEMDKYAIKLAEYLDRKQKLIENVQSKFNLVRMQRDINSTLMETNNA